MPFRPEFFRIEKFRLSWPVLHSANIYDFHIYSIYMTFVYIIYCSLISIFYGLSKAMACASLCRSNTYDFQIMYVYIYIYIYIDSYNKVSL